MGIRWYIAGHAPWSNAYESIVFIAGSTVLAGIILARQSPFALAGTAILAGVTMGVAHMNFINPEITNLGSGTEVLLVDDPRGNYYLW